VGRGHIAHVHVHREERRDREKRRTRGARRRKMSHQRIKGGTVKRAVIKKPF